MSAAYPCVSVPQALLELYREHEGPLGLPGLSALLQRAMAAELEANGVRLPATTPPSRTAAATAAATRARVERRERSRR